MGLTTDEARVKEQEFINTPFQFSFNSLSKLLTVPSQFYKEYVLGEREKVTTKYFTKGELIHYLVLQDGHIDDKYCVLPNDLPSPNVVSILDKLYAETPEKSLDECADRIDEILTEINLYQTIKDRDKRVAKVADDKGVSYWNYLHNAEGKIAISSDMMLECVELAEIIKSNDEIMRYLGRGLDGDRYAVYNEYELQIDKLSSYNFGLKGVIDNFVVDTQDKIVYINDFKTTSKNIQDFPESVKNYGYYWQAAIYYTLIKKCMKLEDDWQVKFAFIVFDKNNQLYRYEVLSNTMEAWRINLSSDLSIASWHLDNMRFDLPYKFAIGKMKL